MMKNRKVYKDYMINESLSMKKETAMIITISKGLQISIPAELRKQLNLSVGTRVELTKKGKELVIKPLDADLEQLFEEAKSRKPKYRMTAKQMDELIEHEIHRH